MNQPDAETIHDEMAALALVAAALGSLATYLGARVMSHATNGFDRSRRELRENVAWFKKAIRHARSETSPH